MTTEAARIPPRNEDTQPGHGTNYRISEHDYVRAMRLHAKATPQRWLISGALVTLLGLLAVFGPPVASGGAIGGLIGIGIVWISSYAILPLIWRRNYRAYKSIQGSFSVALLDDGLRFQGDNGDGIVVWNHICKWRHNDGYVLVYLMPRLFHIVPKSVSADGFDVMELLVRLSDRVGPAS